VGNLYLIKFLYRGKCIIKKSQKALTARLLAGPTDDLTIAVAERLAAKCINDRIAGAVQVAEPPAL